MYRKPTSIIYMIFNYEILEDISNETYKYLDQYMEQNHVVEKELRDGNIPQFKRWNLSE